jgi:asparagine synthetase B (glutamine-hydrolysing)
MRVDKMTMATSVETRVPFLDHELVEFAMPLPPEMKVRRGTSTSAPSGRSVSHRSPSAGCRTTTRMWAAHRSGPVNWAYTSGTSTT